MLYRVLFPKGLANPGKSGRTPFTNIQRGGNARTFTVAKFHELAVKPKTLNWEEAATIPIGGLAAYQALFRSSPRLLLEPRPRDWGSPTFWEWDHNQKETILITGAATPAGVWAVQLAKLAGVGTITATCDADSMDLVRRLGADQVYDWTEKGSLRGWDRETFSVVLDFMGGRTLTRAWGLVAENGKISSVVEDAQAARPANADPTIRPVAFAPDNCPKPLNIIATLADRARDPVQAVCDPEDVFFLEDHKKAFAKLATHPRGQVVLKLDSENPRELIATLEKHGRVWETREFTNSRIQEGFYEDEPEPFRFANWLERQGSNHPDLASEAELNPPARRPLSLKIVASGSKSATTNGNSG